MGARRYLLSKVLQAVITLAFVLVFNFFLFHILPGNPARTLARNKLLPPAAVHKLEQEFGLNDSLPKQFAIYVGQTFRGNLGLSYQFRAPVTSLIRERVWNTLLLIGTSTIASTIIGLLIGIHGAWRRGSALDLGSLGFALVTYAMPEFWLGLLLLAAFAGGIGIFPALFPTGGIVTPGASFTGFHHFADV